MLKNKTYISGKITGLSKKGSDEASLFSKEVINIYEVVPYDKSKSWKDYMIEDMNYLLDCDAIYMLSNWGDSKGARIERAIAIELGIEVIYQTEYNNNIK